MGLLTMRTGLLLLAVTLVQFVAADESNHRVRSGFGTFVAVEIA